MKKYMCNGCGKLHDFHIDAAICHPDVVEVDDENLPERAAQLLRAAEEEQDGYWRCPKCRRLWNIVVFGERCGICSPS